MAALTVGAPHCNVRLRILADPALGVGGGADIRFIIPIGMRFGLTLCEPGEALRVLEHLRKNVGLTLCELGEALRVLEHLRKNVKAPLSMYS